MGVHPAAVGVDVGGFVDSGEGEAPDVDFHAVPVGRDVEGDGAVGTLGDTLAGGGGHHATFGIGAVGEEDDDVVVGGVAEHVAVEADINLLRGVELGSAEADGGEVAFGADEVGIVDSDGVGGVGVDGGPVVAVEEAAGGGVEVVGETLVAEVGGLCEGAGKVGHGFEACADEELFLGSWIFDEGVVSPVDVAAFPHGAYGRTKFTYLGSHVTA